MITELDEVKIKKDWEALLEMSREMDSHFPPMYIPMHVNCKLRMAELAKELINKNVST